MEEVSASTNGHGGRVVVLFGQTALGVDGGGVEADFTVGGGGDGYGAIFLHAGAEEGVVGCFGVDPFA